MLQHPAAVRAAYTEVVETLLATLRAVEPYQWELPGLGEWTVRQLAAHTLRSFSLVDSYIRGEPSVDRVMADASEFYRVALADPTVHREVARRGRAAGDALPDPVGQAEVLAEQALATVAGAADDDPAHTRFGTMPLSEYLATRVVELSVHVLDLQRAIGRPLRLGPEASAMAVGVVAQLVDAPRLLLALTGRGPLPADYNVLG